MLFSLLKHHFDLNITDTALKVSRSLYCFTTSISHGVQNYFPRLWGTGISDAIFKGYSCLQVETVGDVYVLVSGLPQRNGDRHIVEISDCALDLLSGISTLRIQSSHKYTAKLRIGN